MPNPNKIAVKRRRPRHPVQPLYKDKDGVVRFVPNRIVQFLIDTSKNNLNDLARMRFDNEDWTQFSALTGYSLSGWGELSYVSNQAWELASKQRPRRKP